MRQGIIFIPFNIIIYYYSENYPSATFMHRNTNFQSLLFICFLSIKQGLLAINIINIKNRYKIHKNTGVLYNCPN